MVLCTSDARAQWIGGRVELGFIELPQNTFSNFLLGKDIRGNAFKDPPKKENSPEQVEFFFSDKAAVGSSLFFYTQDENVEMEVEYDAEELIEYEEEAPPDPEPEPHLEEGHTPGEEKKEEVSEKKEKKKAKGKESKEAKEAREAKEAEAARLAEEEKAEALEEALKPPKMIKKTKIVAVKRKKVQTVCLKRLRLSPIKLPANEMDSPCVYFVRNNPGEIKLNPLWGEAEIDREMDKRMEWGFETGDMLTNLLDLVREVYVPLLDLQFGLPYHSGAQTENAADEGAKAPQVGDAMHSEFRATLAKFESQVSHAIQQVNGEVQLNIPDFDIKDPRDVIDDYELTTQLEVAMNEWSRLISNVVEQENLKKPTGKAPLLEIEFWRQRNAVLSALYEQINLERVQKQLEVLRLMEAPTLPTFNYHHGELTKLYVEAKDNVKFLTTLERHFKNIEKDTKDFRAILDTLPSMMNALRMVWVISRHYNTDERMIPLMGRIANSISTTVGKKVNIKTLLRVSPETAKKLVQSGREVLNSWYSSYMETRARIEASETDHRWEFDKKPLFDKTNYMANVCSDLLEVATTLDEFHKFLGPELKAVTGESEDIDDIMERVEGLPTPLENLNFDIFENKYKDTWAAMMARFRQSVEQIEEMTKAFIETSFKKLRSAEAAFDLVQNFRNIQSRKSINTQIEARYKDIMSQYEKELERLQVLFETHRKNPPIYHNSPPVAGSIAWARDLYLRAKKPILRFKAHESLLYTDYGERVKQQYLVFARAVDAYITNLYTEWETKVGSTASEKLKQPILKAVSDTDGTKNQSSLFLMDRKNLGNPVAKKDEKQFVMPSPPYQVNFSIELHMIIRESKYLDRMGFKISEAALNVTLQEAKYHKFLQDLALMLRNYHQSLASLSAVETQLFSEKLTELQEALRPGFTPLNWNSQRIGAFIDDSNLKLSQFQGIVSQIHKSSTMIIEVISEIENTVLIEEKDFLDAYGELHPLEVADFYDILENKRVSRLDNLVTKYNSIESLLVKVEEVVVGSNSGMSRQLAGYYHHWEKRIFNAITKMIIKSMASFLALLTSKENPPLCKIKATLNDKDLVVTPALKDVRRLLTKSVSHIVESARFFPRWMHGTCTACPPQHLHEDEEPFVYSYYDDMSQNTHVVNLTMQLNQDCIHKATALMEKYLENWKKHTDFLWNPKRKQQMDALLEKRPPCVYLDAQLASINQMAENVWSQAPIKDIEFLQVNCSEVISDISIKSQEWQRDFGNVLHVTSEEKFKEVMNKIERLEIDLREEPNDLDKLKFVLNTILKIDNMSMDMELAIHDVMERYQTLEKYQLAVPDEQMSGALSLAARWKQLFIDARTRDLRLVKTKDQFREVTRTQALEFKAELDRVKVQFFSPSGPGSGSISLDQGVELTAEYKKKLAHWNEMRQELVNAENLFDLEITNYPVLNELSEKLDDLSKIYSLYQEQKEFEESMASMLWADLDTAQLQNGVEAVERKARKFPKFLKEHPAFQNVEAKIFNFKNSIPLIVNLKNDAMKPRHWSKLMEVTGVKFEMNMKALTLSNIFAMELHKYIDLIDEIINEAVQELKIENEIKKIEAHWKQTSLVMGKYKKDGQDRGFVLRVADDIKLALEDHLLNLQTMAGSRFVGSFADTLRTWEKSLNLVTECLDVWFVVQRKWMYLESIFVGAEDIRLQLPEEAKRFDAIDKAWKQIMTATAKNPNVVEACGIPERIEALKALSDRLDNCQKSLSDYLDTKRNSFPRFFFISDDELLSILGSSDPTSIQEHLLKLFDNVKFLHFGRGNKTVTGMESSETEAFELTEPTQIDGPVESWMTTVEDNMHSSLNVIAKKGVFLYAELERTQWLKQVLGMIGIVGSQIWWTWEVEDSFRRVLAGNKYAMKELEAKLTGQLNDLVAMVRTNLDKLTRKKVNTLLIIDVHARDIVDGFVRESILNAKEFAWESQLRFYWERDIDDIIIRQCTGEFHYGYEYMGLNGRLVITPLTDRCYMTLTQALTFKLGGAPAGPAGTGKTETTKDLSKSLALPCFVINCGEGLDYRAMGSTFSGLVQVGAWGCFDEFNRINIEVLSVVSAQLKAIQNALIGNRPTVDIGFGVEIKIKRIAGFATCGVFITMNPGYAGRTELPDNLKALFRPVTMIVPDLQQICEIMLFSEGFEGAKVLAKKMTVLYKLSREQLSKQYHYDFGLRSLKSVLVMAGGLKRQYAELSEDVVLMRTLRDSNMPKFVFEDVPLFSGLITDLFPGETAERVGYEDLKNAIARDLEKNLFKCSEKKVFEEQVDKVVQMYETQLVRHTTMIVGPTGGGKSLVLDTLRNSRLDADGTLVKMFFLNAKAQPLNELYGTMDPVTRDWTDGILSKLFRELNQPLPQGKENEFRLIIYDGDVDAVWVENMNSVMDDNRLLTLPNGERIRLQPHCAMVCETFDLQYASPATISRCGMVWVDPKNLGYRPYYERWLKLKFGESCLSGAESARNELPTLLMNLFDKYVKKCIDYVLTGIIDGVAGEKLRGVIPITNIDMVKQLCSCLDSFLSENVTDKADREGIYIFSLLWSIGGCLIADSRPKFEAFLKKISGELLPDNIYTHFYNVQRQGWVSWQTEVPAYAEPQPFRFYEVMVPTTDGVLYSFLLEKLAPRKPLLFVGQSGTAKTVTIESYMRKLDREKNSLLTMNFSSRTMAKDVQISIEANVDKRSGTIYGPPSERNLICFIDDLNMPKVDLYGTQQPITFLLFLMSRGGFYDRGKELFLKTIKDLQYIGAMGPPGGGRNNVDPRFIAQFNVCNLVAPSPEVLLSIYSSIINARVVNHTKSIQECASKFPKATLELFELVLDRLPATPSKFHYIFNLRDLSRIFEGLCLATTDQFYEGDQIVRLWRNECYRVFCDRLATEEDINMIEAQIKRIIEEQFASSKEKALADPMVFGDFKLAVARVVEDAEDPRLYQDLGEYKDIRRIFEEILDNYNAERKAMLLVLFEMALEHLTRIHRIIRMPRGNALLVGVGGSGKQSLTRLAAYTAGYKVFEISLVRNYGENEFREDLKTLYTLLGKGEVVFLFTDAHVVEEGFLEFLNNMLTTGIVPALFDEEKDQLINSVRKEVKEAGLIDTPDTCWNFFVNKCRNNLHIVLSMSPSGDKLRVRCRNFPGMISACVIDWFFPWPENALQAVAQYFLAEETLLKQHKPQIINHLVFTHLSVVVQAKQFAESLRRYYYVTPKNYLDFISNYRDQLKTNNKKIENSVKRLQGGLSKLVDAAEQVDKMQVELTQKKVIVDAKTRTVEALIEEIRGKKDVAAKQQAEASIKQKDANEQAEVIKVEKEKADVALGEALPAVEAAAAALDNLRKEDLTEIRGFASPPIPVKAVCAAVIVFRPTGEKLDEESWADAKKMLGAPQNGGILNMLKNYPKDKIKEAQVKKVNAILKEYKITEEQMKSASRAGYGLFVWVSAILRYYEVAKQVQPLRDRVRDMERAQTQTEKELEELTVTLTNLKQELAILDKRYKEANGELTQLQHQAGLMEKRLKAASKLISGLTGERTRWTSDIASLKSQQTQVVGDCLLASSFLSYTGAFTTDYRRQMIYSTFLSDIKERSIPVTATFKLEALLTTDATVQGWLAKGLPADEHSVQNGILTTAASRFPLCIDPQQQAVNWIKNTFAAQKLTVKSLNDPDFMKHLELAIQFGKPFLFENVDEELDPMLDPVLEKNIVIDGGQKLLKLSDKTIDWDDNFRLFFTSKLSNPHYSPEVMGKTMIINYGVTQEGLSNQLLNVVVGHERPDLEAQYAELVTEMSENAALIVQLEDTLLRELSSTTGNILDNEELIATLDETKTKAVEIQGKLEQSKFTTEEISKARSVYKPVAKRGSILYFSIAGLALISSMYEISLDSFLGVFNSALDSAKRDVVLDNRLNNMINSITANMYDYTCTGIFERHKLMFSFQMTCMIMMGEGTLNKFELDFFLKGDTSLEGPKTPSPVKWLSLAGWKDFLCLSTMNAEFEKLLADFTHNPDVWKAWYDLEVPEEEPLPQGGDSVLLSPLQRLCVVRCFRPDRVYNAVKLFVINIMTAKFVQPPVLNYHRIFNQSSPTMPMVFILSPGADPQSDIQRLAEEMGFIGSRFKFIALGQGQGPLAEQYMEIGYTKGHWVLLQNCHLLASWLKNMEKTLELMKEPHKDFRLWLTTEPTDKFPLGILQRSLKVVTEPPDGLKLNMRSIYAKIDQTIIDECPHYAFRSCLYVLAFLHAVVLERRKYGKIGWNVPYDFNESDFLISRALLSLYLTKAYEDEDEFLPWGSLKYLVGDAMYGGRVSDDMDRRVLVTYLQEYMGDFLFDDCQKFYFSQAGFNYELPEFGPVENYKQTIETLPLSNSPAVFGLHPNAEIGYFTNASKQMWKDLINLQPRSGGSGEGLSREDYIMQVAKDVEGKIPIESMDVGTYDLMVIRRALIDRNKGQPPTPCQVVLLQELERWNNLVKRMAATLQDLKRALVGEIGMSDDLDALGDSLYNAFLPNLWRKLCPDTQKPLGSWMTHFTKRHQQYESWIANGEPAVIWLSGLHIPESYLTALVQTACRLKSWPLDKSTLYTNVTQLIEEKEISAPLETGCYVVGLYLEGAAWDQRNSVLCRQEPKVLVTELPILQVIPIEASKLKLQNTFKTPVYVTQARRNAMGVGLVFEADLATHEHASHWVLQGVALSLNVDT